MALVYVVDIYENGQVRNVLSEPPTGLALGCEVFLPVNHNLLFYGGSELWTPGYYKRTNR